MDKPLDKPILKPTSKIHPQTNPWLVPKHKGDKIEVAR